MLVGAVSFSGSAVTFAKLQELMTTRPVIFPGLRGSCRPCWSRRSSPAGSSSPTGSPAGAIALLLLGLAAGLLLVLPVGGADVPIVISLLNAFTGLAVAASGIVLGNVLLLVAGTLVGASGTILTRAMASAMGRGVSGHPVRRVPRRIDRRVDRAERPARCGRPAPEDVAILLGYAQRVVIVPGYGLAVAQAQHTIAELATTLEARGVEVDFAHPPRRRPDAGPHERAARRGERSVRVAQGDGGGQPGVQDTRMSRSSSARTTWSTRPRSRRPARRSTGCRSSRSGRRRQVVFLKRSMRPGFAGIENELLYDPKTTLLFGDAKDSLTKVLGAVNAL